MTALYVTFFNVIVMVTFTVALDNGLARTPPMGWLSWERFGCNTECDVDPDNCISEKLYKQMADHLVADGYRDAGYEYVNIDDCWAAKSRDETTNRLAPDPKRFPNGIKSLADYVHSKGLKLGIYTDIGNLTCAGYPGSGQDMALDAQTFAEWGIDSLKVDDCHANKTVFNVTFPQMEMALNKTGRPILLNCDWPKTIDKPDYPTISHYCNTWRNFADINDSWDSVRNIIKFYGDDKGNFSAVAGPGGFNDPDMIIIGDNGLSKTQQQIQMAMWAMFAAPLFLSVDLRTIDPQARELFLNPGAIAINQDKLGQMGTRAWQYTQGHIHLEAWSRPTLPPGSYAVAVLNLSDTGPGIPCLFCLEDVSVISGKYNVTEVFTGKFLGTFSVKHQIQVHFDEQTVLFLKYVYVGDDDI